MVFDVTSVFTKINCPPTLIIDMECTLDYLYVANDSWRRLEITWLGAECSNKTPSKQSGFFLRIRLYNLVFSWRCGPTRAMTSSVSRFLNHTQHSSGRVISSSQRPLPDNTQHPQQTNIRVHAIRGIRTHNLSRRAAADLRLGPRGYWHRNSFI